MTAAEPAPESASQPPNGSPRGTRSAVLVGVGLVVCIVAAAHHLLRDRGDDAPEPRDPPSVVGGPSGAGPRSPNSERTPKGSGRGKRQGSWTKVRPRGDRTGASLDEAEALLDGIGYLSGTNKPRGNFGVTIHDPSRAQDGTNLMISGHAPGAVLMDMAGKIVHRWSLPTYEAFPAREKRGSPRDHYWRRVLPYENGDLLVIVEGIGLFKVDKDSTLLWANECGAHHHMSLDEEGRIYVLTREARVIEDVDPDKPTVEDFITLLDPNGDELSRVSLIDCMRNAGLAELLLDPRYPNGKPIVGDVLHANTLTYLDASRASWTPLAKPGQLLVSLRNVNLIGVVDFEAERFVWSTTGGWRMQHEPVLLDSGHIVLFDNQGVSRRSRILEFEPESGDVTWKFEEDQDDAFYSAVMGVVARLENGNTLVTESTYGRVFELTPEKQVVWEYRSSYRTGENQELVAVLPELLRMPKDYGAGWVRGSGR